MIHYWRWRTIYYRYQRICDVSLIGYKSWAGRGRNLRLPRRTMCFDKEHLYTNTQEKNSSSLVSIACHPFQKTLLPRWNPSSTSTTALIHGRWHLVAFVTSTIVLANSIGRRRATLQRNVPCPKWYLVEEMFSEQF